MDSTRENKDVWVAICPINCLSLKSFPDKQTQLHYRAASLNIYFHQVDLDDVALLDADLQGKDLKEELDLGLDPLGRVVGPPAARYPEK